MISNTINRIALFVLLLCVSFSMKVTAQETDSLPLFKKFPFIPSFPLVKTDSSKFEMKQVVPEKQAAVVILFSPTCSHCQHQAEEITSHMQALKDVTFIFATTYPMEEIKQYESDYGLQRFPNIYIGQDKAMNLVKFYPLRGLPGIFVYNKKGKLTTTFNTNVSASQLEKAIQK